MLTQNAIWCQNRGCICISSVRRTYGQIHSSFLHTPVIHTSTIILWSELFPKKRREKIQGEILQSQSSSNPRVFPVILQELQDFFEYSVFLQELQCFHTQSSNSKFPQLILCTELILLQEILQLQGSSHVIPCRSVQGIFQ